ncbi:MAG TPA: hypothetical protein VK453_26640 [Micromonosporaceae bacterium]|nr:hypothetical protein [Micromonosporaceae bacterium]
MDDILIRDALRAHVTQGEPPLTLSSAGLIHTGRKARRRRSLSAAGAALSLLVVAAGGGALLAHRPAAVEQAGHEVASLQCPDVLAAGTPLRDPAAAAARVTCYLEEATTELMPKATFRPAEARVGTKPLVARVQGNEISAYATVVDTEGIGSLSVAVMRATTPPAEIIARCAEKHAKASCRTEPGSATIIEVYDFGVEPNGAHTATVYAHTGATVVVATAANRVESAADTAPATRPDLPLTIDGLITLARHPALVLYP